MTSREPYACPSRERTIPRRLQAFAVLLFFALLLSHTAGHAQPGGKAPERYRQVRIDVASAAELPPLPSLDEHGVGYGADGGLEQKGEEIEMILSESDVRLLQEKGIEVTILIPDLQRFYAERAAEDLREKKVTDGTLSRLSSPPAENAPANFSLGSVAGYYAPEELANELRKMRDLYPELVSEPVSIGKSSQGRDIVAVRISGRPESEALPEVLYTGMHHAREPISMMSLVYTMWSALEGYARDPELTGLLNGRALWFVPLVNPDGYAYNVQYFPEGGGLWRKNRSGPDNEGVDLNRNYGSTATWQTPPPEGIDDPLSGIYRGPAPFSEPETRAIRDFVRAHDFRTALHFHSYSNVLIYQHGGEVPELADTAWYVTSARELALENGLGHGRGAEAIGYEAAGTVDEWMFTAGTGGRHIFTWTPEIGSNEDGFWPIPSRIPFLCNQILPMNLRAAWMAGPYPRITSWNLIDSNGIRELELTVANVGVERMNEGGEIRLEGFSEATVHFPPLAPGQSIPVRTALPQAIVTRPASRQELDLRIRYESQEWSRTISAIVHPLSTLIGEDFESSLVHWHTGLWDVETDQERGRVLSDSPYENYFESDIPNIIELAMPISLVGYDAAELQFEAKVVIRGVQHHLALEARKSNEGTWHRLDAEYLQRPSTINSEERGEFRGGNRAWAHYSVPLDRFAGEDVLVRFVMNTPYSGTNGPLFDGALIDDLKILAARAIPTSATNRDPENLPPVTVWPNPCRNVLHVQPGSAGTVTVRLVDLLGREVMEISGSSTLSLSTAALPDGAYILSVDSGAESYRQKILKE